MAAGDRRDDAVAMRSAQSAAAARDGVPRAVIIDTPGVRLGLVVGASEYARYERELGRLRAARTRELPERLRRARGFVAADAIEEIAHIHEDHAVVDARIARLEDLLRTATVVADAPGDDAVAIGCVVEVEYRRTGRRARYRLSGIAAAADGLSVSARSPVGQALMGRRAGDVVSVELPAGRVEELRIVAIAPPVAEAS
jgi:transcription elongation factor GreA